MRDSKLVVAVVAACLAPQWGSACVKHGSREPDPGPSFAAGAEPKRASPTRGAPPPTIEPAPVIERDLGPNPGCPKLRVFTDAEDLCAHGIMPLHPFGQCDPIPRTDAQLTGPETHADENATPALAGVAELFVRHYLGSGAASIETLYLALRGRNGYVLLSELGEYDPQINDVPTFERFVGTTTSVELTIAQEFFWDEGHVQEEPEHFNPQDRRRSIACTLDDAGGIRCNGACPDLAIAKQLPALDCAAISRFRWARLARGVDVSEDWGGRRSEMQLMAVIDWLALQPGFESAAAAEQEQHEGWGGDPKQVRQVTIEDQGERAWLDVLELSSGPWVLVDGEIPLVASDDEIRVGRGPGGVFVTSSRAGSRQIHRLDLATLDLEPVSPGPCG